MIRIYAHEAWNELREGLRSPLVPLMFLGLAGYTFIMLGSADMLRDMGGADVPRNSPSLVALMMSGQSFWLIFVWAWVFAQVVVRDRSASLHELVLAAPVSLNGLLCARYLGALALALVLGSATGCALLMVPLLGQLGMYPPDAVQSTPFAALGFSWLLFVLPSAVGLGALYTTAALRTRSTAGAFSAAALVILLWMGSMTVLRSGDVDPATATWIDVSGYGEAEHQVMRWTPAQKRSSLIALSAPLVGSRALWTLLPLVLLGLTLVRLSREQLVLAPASKPTKRRAARPNVTTEPLEVTRPSWLHATLSEAAWHLRETLSRRSFLFTAGLWTIANVAGTFVHMVGHANGPFVPRSELLVPFLLKFTFAFSVFIVAGFVGTLARRDQRLGFDELVDASPAPLATRVLGRALSAFGATLAMALVLVLSAWIVTALASPSFSFWNPLVHAMLVATPALLELCAATFLVHALVRSTGLAHGLAMFVAFIALVNEETGMVTYPPAQFGLAVQVELSELAGWSPWLASVLTLDVLKLATVLLAVACAWLAYPRGTALTLGTRVRAAWKRARGGAGVLAAGASLVIALTASLLHDRFVDEGGYLSKSEQNDEHARWERSLASLATPFAVEGGALQVELEPSALSATSRWQLHAVRGERLLGQLRDGMTVREARVDGAARSVRVLEDHFVLELSCPRGCEVELLVHATRAGWPFEDETAWLDEDSVFARAQDIVPKLGFDGESLLRAAAERRARGLPEALPELTAAALQPAAGVAPAGTWRWSVSAPRPASGATHGELDFAFAWAPRAQHTRVAGLRAVHGASHVADARDVLADARSMQVCVSDLVGTVAFDTVVQAPRALGQVGLHGTTLWLPENDSWDVGAKGFGRNTRRVRIAQAIAARGLADRAGLRGEPGARWLTQGVAGWIGLECLRRSEGTEAWIAQLDHRSKLVVEKLGAVDAQVRGLADDRAAEWVDDYAPLSVLSWANSVPAEKVRSTVSNIVEAVRAGKTVAAALADEVGQVQAAEMLGVPLASDVRVAAAGAHPQIRGERARWQDGGWQAIGTQFEVVTHAEGELSRTLRVPTDVVPRVEFTVFDAWPSFERSPRDNAWSPTARP
jgi:hypothetical protein